MAEEQENTQIEHQRAVVIGELHADDNDPVATRMQVEKYHAVFAGLADNGFQDAMVEVSPQLQAELNDLVSIYSQTSPENLEKILYDSNDPVTTYQAQAILSAMYDVQLHAVDVGYRSDIDTYRFVQPKMREYMFQDPPPDPPNMEQFLNDFLDQEDREYLNRINGKEVSSEEVLGAIAPILEEGLDSRLDRRVIEDDSKVAKTMLDRAEGRPFFAIMGLKHGGLIDEDAENFERVDVEGALRIALGSSNVFHMSISDPEGVEGLVDFPENVLRDELDENGAFKIEKIGENEPEIDPEVREAASQKSDIPMNP